jgi:uncharacterized membrane protein YedE/YeeE
MAKLRSAWYGLVMAGGLGFGLIGERRPFGNDTLAHPLVVYFAAVAVGLLILRVVLARPVPEVIPERVLVAGCLSGVAAFLVGNFVNAHMVGGLMPQ